jgi:ABC-type transport system substrate-binding protein
MKIILILFILSSTAYADTLSICLETKSAPISEIDEILFPKIYEGLVRYNALKKKYFPVLIEKISMTNSKVIHIEIKKKIYFHSNKYFSPTRTLNTDDVIFSFKQAQSLNNIFISNIESINKVSNTMMVISGKTSFTDVYKDLSVITAAIKSKEYYEYTRTHLNKEIFNSEPIGTGPYQVNKITSNSITLKNFVKHPSKTGSIKEIIYKFKDSENKNSCNITQVIATK